jgi:hypothetical protein
LLERGGAATLAVVALPAVGAAAVLWWIIAVGAVLTSVVSALVARRSGDRLSPLVMVPLVVGLSMGFSYLFMLRYGQLRFIQSAAGLLALPVAYGLLQATRIKARAAGAVIAGVLALVLVGVQANSARQLRAPVVGSARMFSAIVDRLPQLGVTGRCGVAGLDSYTVAYQVGCRALGSVKPGAAPPASVVASLGRGENVAVVLRTRPAAGTFLDGWRLVPVPVHGGKPWYVYLPPA